jgi:hypothetical protein
MKVEFNAAEIAAAAKAKSHSNGKAGPHHTSDHSANDDAEDAPGTLYGGLRVFGMDELDAITDRDYLLKGLISPDEISLWVGPPKMRQIFLAHTRFLHAVARKIRPWPPRQSDESPVRGRRRRTRHQKAPPRPLE